MTKSSTCGIISYQPAIFPYLHAHFFSTKNQVLYSGMSKVYSLKAVQNIPIAPTAAWDFFSSPANLASITPGNISFKIISVHHGEKMYAGQVIEYKLRPVLNIPVYWMTEITHVEDKVYFVDEQSFGPFSMWHHQHHFKVIGGGVEMTDIVHYKLPLWFLGDIANALFVKKRLKKVFDYRYSKIEKLFGSLNS